MTNTISMKHRYNDFNTYLRNLFGCRVQKITIDAGLTCPNRDGTLASGGCIYCNARGSGTGVFAEGLSITDQIVDGKQRLARRYKAKKFIAYFQSFSNTYGPIDKLKRMYEEALGVEGVVGLSIGTRPDCIGDDILDLLAAYAKDYLVWIEYGLQSANEQTLKFINRGHDVSCFVRAVEATREKGINICAHVIMGLPGEEKTHMMQTADFISNLGIEGIKIHLLYVVKGTPMERLHKQGSYRCLEQQEYVELVCDFLERIPQHMIVQRLTGDPHPHELLAPQWALKKAETLGMIRQTLEKRNTWQGKFFESSNFLDSNPSFP